MADYRVPILDAFEFQQPVLDKDLTTAPTSPTKAQRYILGGVGGGWSGGIANDIGYWTGSAWVFVTPTEGYLVWIKDEDKFYKFTGTAWTEYLGQTGPTGATGPTGSTGPTGTTGPDATYDATYKCLIVSAT